MNVAFAVKSNIENASDWKIRAERDFKIILQFVTRVAAHNGVSKKISTTLMSKIQLKIGENLAEITCPDNLDVESFIYFSVLKEWCNNNLPSNFKNRSISPVKQIIKSPRRLYREEVFTEIVK